MGKRKVSTLAPGPLNCLSTPLQNFSVLQKVKGLSDQHCREIVSLLREDGFGKKTASRCQSTCQAHQLLREDKVEAHGAEGAMVLVPYLYLPDLAQRKVEACKLYSANLLKASQRNPEGLHLVLFADEASVGNIIRPDQRRKSWACYCTFLEMQCLFMDTSWITYSLIRTDEVKQAKHGYAEILSRLMRNIRRDSEHGFPIDFQGDVQLIRVKKIILLADLDAIRSGIGCKGSSGLKPCHLCTNVLSAWHDHVPGFLSIRDPLPDQFVPRSQESLDQVQKYLATLPEGKSLEEAEKLTGWHRDGLLHGPLCDVNLSSFFSISGIYLDSLHTYFCNGLIPHELGLWYEEACKSQKLSISLLKQYVGRWQFLDAQNSCFMGAFNAKLWKRQKDYKGDASQSISALYGVVAFQEEIFNDCPAMQLAGVSLRHLFAIAQILLNGKHDLDEVKGMTQKQVEHAKAFSLAYGASKLRPKARMAFHLEEQYLYWRRLLDAFPCERKHRSFKSTVAPRLQKLETFSKSALLRMANIDLYSQRKTLNCWARTCARVHLSVHS